MAKRVQNEYQPDYVSSPGETLLETLETIGMSQVELAKRMGRPVKTINEIIQRKAAITAETALQLEQVLHIPASFWLKREQHYRESLARFNQKSWNSTWNCCRKASTRKTAAFRLL
jgi:addiction module HigA family antidote